MYKWKPENYRDLIFGICEEQLQFSLDINAALTTSDVYLTLLSEWSFHMILEFRFVQDISQGKLT